MNLLLVSYLLIVPALASFLRNPATPTDPQGAVISNVQIVMVVWNSNNAVANNQFIPEIITNDQTPAAPPNMMSFYSEIVNDPWFDVLKEYNTNTQAIGAGSFGGKYTIIPTVVALLDTDIMSELSNQISACTIPPTPPPINQPPPINPPLPCPEVDLSINPLNTLSNTLYVVHLPKDLTITYKNGGQKSCHDWCGTHNIFTHVDPKSNINYNIPFAIIPDFTTNPCNCYGCSSLTHFQATTLATSHEIAEAVTDPVPGKSWCVPPPGDYEIGDICFSAQLNLPLFDTIIGVSDGKSYTIQQIWSNKHCSCVTFSWAPSSTVFTKSGKACIVPWRDNLDNSDVTPPTIYEGCKTPEGSATSFCPINERMMNCHKGVYYQKVYDVQGVDWENC